LVVIDKDNEEDTIIKKNIVRFDDNNQLTHNKFCIIDKKAVFTGSFNPTINGAFRNNNNMIIIDSRYLAKNYEDEFSELWDYRFGQGAKIKNPMVYYNNKKIENYFCPEDDCKGKIINTIEQAKSSIYFMTFSFTDEDIADSIFFKNDLDIKGIFDNMQAGSRYSQYHRFYGFGLPVIRDKNPAIMHHKVFIIDNSTVITGSFNPTGAANYKNDENIIIIHDKAIAKQFLDEFERLFI
jgi:phosphatidylserine/phosphatidylglycerophosphate/cardiolipin synthase-like enzyme